MTSRTAHQDADLRATIERRITELETAIEISKAASKVDEPAPDGDPFSAVLASDVLHLIKQEMAAGRVTESVIYFIARNSLYELEAQLRQLREEKSRHMREIARRSRRKGWAVDLAAHLAKAHRSFKEAWRTIPEDDPTDKAVRYAGFEVWRDGDNLHASGPDEDACITMESFRTGYFVPAIKAKS